MSAHGPSAKEFTHEKMRKMESASIPHRPDREPETDEDNYGMTAAKTSNSAAFRHGGHADGESHKPHIGRAHRASGGRIQKVVHGFEPPQHANRIGEYPKIRAHGGKAEHGDEAEDRALVKKMVKPEARTGETHGGRMHRAHGGRAAKGKTVVNVIVAGHGQQQPPPAPPMAPMPPPPMAAPGPIPPRPPMPPQGMPMPMPIAGAPMGAAGAPPLHGGLPPQLRKHGGAVDDPAHFGKGGTKAQVKIKEHAGGGGGLGRMEKARREGARL